MSTAIIIAGMHRSGTSAATGALQLAGVSLGRGLLEPAADNPKGYFENERAVQIHERLLERLGSSWDDVRQLPSDWMAGDAAREARDSIRELIEDEFAGQNVWAVKDPRICRFIPLWRNVLDEMGVNAVSLMVVRKPAEVAASIAARNGWARPLGELLWMRHVFEAEAATRDIPRGVISYDSLLDNPQASLRNAMARLQLPVPLDVQASEDLTDFVDVRYRHHVDTQPSADPFHLLMEEAYMELVSIEGGADRWHQVREIGGQAEELLSEWLPYIEAVAGKAARYRMELIEMEASRFQVQSQLNAQIQWSEEAVARERTLHEQLEESASKQALASTHLARCDQLENDLAQLGNELAQADNALAQANNELAQANNELAQTNNELAKTNNELAHANNELAHANSELAQQLHRHEALLAENEKLNALAASLEESRRGLVAEKQQLEAIVLSLEDAHRALAAEKQQVDANVADLLAQIDQIRRSRSWRWTRPLRAVARFLRP